jgi:hypothetical protein
MDQGQPFSSVRNFIAACPGDWGFPLGGRVDFPFPAEVEFARALRQYRGEKIDFGALRKELTIVDSYHLSIFAVRTAVFAAQSSSPEVYRDALFASMIDDNVDYRDLLGALSIMEDCANRLGLDFSAELDAAFVIATTERQHIIRDVYLETSAELRTPQIFNFVIEGEGRNLQYKPSKPVWTREEMLQQLGNNLRSRKDT